MGKAPERGRAGRRPGGAAADAGGACVFRRSRNGLRPAARPLQGPKKSRLGGQGQQHRLQDAQNGAAAAAVRVPGGVILHTVQGHHLAGDR